MTVTRTKHGAVEIVTINRPEIRNCIDGPTARSLNAVWDAIEADDSIRVVILTGAGDRAFCTGLDLKAVHREGPQVVNEVVLPDTGWCGLTERQFSKPLIAAVNGAAVAGGMELALACDFIVAADHATFKINEVTLGACADGGACFRLPHWIPLPLAKEMLFTGAAIDAHRAYSSGLANRVVPAARLMDEALELAQTIAANPPPSVRAMKRLVHEVLDLPESQAWEINNRYLQWSINTQNFAEGTGAYVENRMPKFQGMDDFPGE
jgi:enoyl-CoA hydratase/carnithine racemase